MKHELDWLQIVDEDREVMVHMPEGKRGIVIGSGENSESWRQRGWTTLDIDPSVGADIIADANHLETVIFPRTQDYIYAEYIRFSREGVDGVHAARLLQQANKVLKNGGHLIIETANFENVPEATLPQRDKFGALMIKHGFEAIVEVDTYTPIKDDQSYQLVIYHGKKVADGFSENRVQ